MLFRTYSKITVVSSNFNIKYFTDRGCTIFTSNQRKSFESLHSSEKAILLYTKQDVIKQQPILSGVVIMDVEYDNYGMPAIHKGLFNCTFHSSKIEKIFHHIGNSKRPASFLMHDIVLYEIYIRLFLLGSSSDPFIKFAEELSMNRWTSLQRSNRWNSKEVVSQLYNVYLTEYTEDSNISILVKETEIQY